MLEKIIQNQELIDRKLDLVLAQKGSYLTVNEYCKRFRLNPKTIQRKCRTGEIPAIKEGKWMIPESYHLNK